jgi:hypothetical protein
MSHADQQALFALLGVVIGYPAGMLLMMLMLTRYEDGRWPWKRRH